ncbi:MAG: hypothetical protein AAGA95_09755 [Pseudomonadota bacterium]
MRKKPSGLSLFLLLLSWLLAGPARSELRWHWDDPFSAQEQRFLESWLTRTAEALESWAGPFPFDVHVHLRRRDDASEPVPWANTWRAGEQSLFFYVDPTYAADEFYADWTAPHEFAHLLLPYLGRDNAWAAEGFASYLQYPLMVQLGVLDVHEAERRRSRKMDRALSALTDESRSLPENLSALRKAGAYSTFYWAGAVYWERVEARLMDRSLSLRAVLRGFLDCCRNERYTLGELATRLDTVVDQLPPVEGPRSGVGVQPVLSAPEKSPAPNGQTKAPSRIFREELQRMNRDPGCPPRPEALSRPGLRLQGQATSEISTAAIRLPSSALR